MNIFNLKEFDNYFWDFRPHVYRDKYADLTKLSILQLKKHYFYYGRFERRLYNNAIKILIVCEQFDNTSGNFTTGGNMALYNLGKLINQKQYKNIYAKMHVFSRNNIKNPYINIFSYDNEVNSRTLVIYPDGNYGNPLNAENVMRWILLEVGTSYRPLNIVNTWGPNDIIYHWELSNIAKNVQILNTCTIDPIFINNNLNKPPNNSCYLIKKRTMYTNNIKFIHPNDSICIDNLSKQQIVDIFNISEKFYCYDLHTFFAIGAIICGCKVILFPDERSKDEYISKSLFNNFKKINKMLAWGESDIVNIDFNNDDINDLIAYLNNLSSSVDLFLNDIDKYFNSSNKYIKNTKCVVYNLHK